VLNRYPGVSSAALGRLTFVSPQAANEMVATLERKGFLERSIDAGNRRRLEVALTRQGATALARCDVLADQLESEVLRGFDASERQRFKAQLQICLEAASAPAPFQPTSERR
jgi:DNA-binding MarR family transcriptional regulator